MFCAKCGAEMKPTDAFCLKCGTENKTRQAAPAQPVQAPAPTAQYAAPVVPAPVYRSGPAAPSYPAPASAPGYPAMPAAPAAKIDKKKLFIILGAAAVALILMITLLARCFGPKAVVRRLLRGYQHENPAKIIRCLPDEIIDEDSIDEDDIEYAIDSQEDIWEEYYGDDCHMSFKILDTKKLTGKEFRHLRNQLEDYYDMDGDRITSAKRVYALVKIKGDEGTGYRVWYYTAVKYAGKWYLTRYR